MKKVIGLFTALVVFTSMSFAAKSAKKNELTVWSFNDELEGIVNEYYKSANPDADLKFTMYPFDQYEERLDEVIKNGNAPDVAVFEEPVLRKYIEQDALLDLTDVYNEVKGDMIEYPAKTAAYNGKIYGLSWAATPGAMIYRRSLAKKYLGTDDPDEVQKYFVSWSKFMETASLIRDRSNGDCVTVASVQDLFHPFLASRKNPWVINNKFVLDPAMLDYMRMAKKMYETGMSGKVIQWTSEWFEGMKGTLCDGRGNPIEVFCYFLPGWGLNYILKPNAAETSGDWAMIKGPAAWQWGGSWISVLKTTKKPAVSKAFVKKLASDEDFQEKLAMGTNETACNKKVLNKIKGKFNEPYLSGQNSYALYAEIAEEVPGGLGHKADNEIASIWANILLDHVNGVLSEEEAIKNLKDEVKSQLGY